MNEFSHYYSTFSDEENSKSEKFIDINYYEDANYHFEHPEFYQNQPSKRFDQSHINQDQNLVKQDNSIFKQFGNEHLDHNYQISQDNSHLQFEGVFNIGQNHLDSNVDRNSTEKSNQIEQTFQLGIKMEAQEQFNSNSNSYYNLENDTGGQMKKMKNNFESTESSLIHYQSEIANQNHRFDQQTSEERSLASYHDLRSSPQIQPQKQKLELVQKSKIQSYNEQSEKKKRIQKDSKKKSSEKTKSKGPEKKKKKSNQYTEEELDQELEEYTQGEEIIIRQQSQLLELKQTIIDKKELQIQRNRITAQLSRDKKELEFKYLRNRVVYLQNSVNRYETEQVKQAKLRLNEEKEGQCQNQDQLTRIIQSSKSKQLNVKDRIKIESNIKDQSYTKKNSSKLLKPRTSSKITSGLMMAVALVSIICLSANPINQMISPAQTQLHQKIETSQFINGEELKQFNENFFIQFSMNQVNQSIQDSIKHSSSLYQSENSFVTFQSKARHLRGLQLQQNSIQPLVVQEVNKLSLKKDKTTRPLYEDYRDKQGIIYAIDDDDNQTNDFENTTLEQEYKKNIYEQFQRQQKLINNDDLDDFEDQDDYFTKEPAQVQMSCQLQGNLFNMQKINNIKKIIHELYQIIYLFNINYRFDIVVKNQNRNMALNISFNDNEYDTTYQNKVKRQQYEILVTNMKFDGQSIELGSLSA
ncbi:UNKNOWN [Stylonychia lemnae]|uniref:Uncharacterized protein n=1 Tax=Stylonychia lemnae TaxID=5949 RepID=A0A078B0F5_STYLE|nr:UNKNOWN [Stylonychia lemnae]|eukprot:CDW88135.1 UNKNOWN [Stylonychia lemnae]